MREWKKINIFVHNSGKTGCFHCPRSMQFMLFWLQYIIFTFFFHLKKLSIEKRYKFLSGKTLFCFWFPFCILFSRIFSSKTALILLIEFLKVSNYLICCMFFLSNVYPSVEIPFLISLFVIFILLFVIKSQFCYFARTRKIFFFRKFRRKKSKRKFNKEHDKLMFGMTHKICV